MAVKMLIKRKVSDPQAAELNRLLTQMRILAMGQDGYVSGETLKRIDKVSTGVAQLSFQNPLVYIKVSNEVVPVAVARQAEEGGTRMRGLIVVRDDGGIDRPRGAAGKEGVGGVDPVGRGYLSQKEFLKKRKIDTVMDLLLREATDNVEENVILDVFEGRADAGFISETALHRMDRAIDPKWIRVLATTSWVPSWVFAAHRSVPEEDVARIRRVLLSLSGDQARLARIGVDGFVAPDAAYLKSVEQLDFW